MPITPGQGKAVARAAPARACASGRQAGAVARPLRAAAAGGPRKGGPGDRRRARSGGAL